MKQDDRIKKWIKEAGRERPSSGFSQRVMAAVEKTHSSVSTYQPVISPWIMKGLLTGLAAFYVAVIFLSPGTEGSDSVYLDKLKSLTGQSSLKMPDLSVPSFTLPDMDWSFMGASPVFAYSLLAVAIMAMFMAMQQSYPAAFSRKK